MESILSSAILYDGVIVGGKRHKDIINALEKLAGKRYDEAKTDREFQGFLTSTGRYVNRSEAFQIAVKANQLLFPKLYGDLTNLNKELTSEDLYGIDKEN